MLTRQQTILIVSNDAALSVAARKRFEGEENGVRIAVVSSLEGARRALENARPSVIVLDEFSLATSTNTPSQEVAPLTPAVAALAAYAPVVVIAPADLEAGLAALITAGAADFASRGSGCVDGAMDFVERRLRKTKALGRITPRVEVSTESAEYWSEDFGGMLRHELNNPLTGILGNAELLLAEVKRKGGDRMPPGGQQRLETIAALAVRLRETVRRLSQEWETRHQPAPSTCGVGSITLPLAGE